LTALVERYDVGTQSGFFCRLCFDLGDFRAACGKRFGISRAGFHRAVDA